MTKPGSHSESPSAGSGAKRRIIIALIVSGVMALAYVGTVHYLDSRNTLVFKGTCSREDSYILRFRNPRQKKEKFWILNLRPGRVLIETDRDIESLKLVTTEESAVPAVKVSDRLFAMEIKANLVIGSVRLSPREDSVKSINVRISREPVLSLPLAGYQFAFLFILISLGFLTILSLYGLIIERQSPRGPPFTMLVPALLLLITAVFVFSVLNVGGVLDFSGHPDPQKALRASLLFNIFLAILLLIAFFLFSSRPRGQKLPLLLPLLVGLPIVFIVIPFVTRSVGDSLLWVLNLGSGNPDISFAESLSLMINKIFFRVGRSLFGISARTTLITTGKIIGLIFLLALFRLVNSFEELSLRKKLALFLIVLTFGFNVLFFGLPEFSYYPLPFLLLSVLSAQRYIRPGSSTKPLVLSAFLAVVAGLFHGSAFFSLPVILLLPLLKPGPDGEDRRWKSLLKPYVLIVLTAGVTFLAFLGSVRVLGFNLLFHTAAGGFDGRRFISFLPVHIHFPKAVNFLENGYFISRAWILFITGAFAFMILLVRWKNRFSLTRSDFLLFLFGISQFLIVLFWGFDLGVREMDLYIAPTTLLFIFLAKVFAGSVSDEKSAWKFILPLALLSPAYFLVLITT
ncbi:MAG: hypothetical protein H6P98_2563 [Candidatus Aminicenantes bacterium]|nr:hypothetical protein [Candidatus Aminicenantes bacterium]